MITEVLPKIGDSWIITVAVDRFSRKVISVVSDLIFYVSALRVELVFFGSIRSVQVLVLCHPFGDEIVVSNPVIIHMFATFPVFLVSRL